MWKAFLTRGLRKAYIYVVSSHMLFKCVRVVTWWARQIRSRSCLCRNLATTSEPKVKDTPLSFSPQPKTSLSGSDQSKSHSRPWSGTSVGRMMRLICSMDWRSGDSPNRGSKRTNKHVDNEVEKCCAESQLTSVSKLQRTNGVSWGQRQTALAFLHKNKHLVLQKKNNNSPPWQQKIFSSTMAAIGRQLKQSVKVFHSLMLYLLLPKKKKISSELFYWNKTRYVLKSWPRLHTETDIKLPGL